MVLVPALSSETLRENVSAKVSERRKQWLKEQADSRYFASEGAVIRAALDHMEKVGPVKVLEELQED